MANGVLPDVTEPSGVREDITDGETGYIVGLQDIKAMADRIWYMGCHREQISIIGQRAHDCIYPKCQMEKHLEYWTALLDKKSGGQVNI